MQNCGYIKWLVHKLTQTESMKHDNLWVYLIPLVFASWRGINTVNNLVLAT